MGLSVIIPAYNSEKYIGDCLRSIMNQTYKDLQIIVVNDGSEDNTRKIVEKLILEDSRILLINKQNGGVSSARNIGLDNADKEFITFVDSDDTIDSDMYEVLINYICKDDIDIVHCGYKRINDEGIKLINGTGNIVKQSSKEALECLIGGTLFVGSPCNKIYRKKLFDNIRFDESIKINEDVLINYQVFKKSAKSIFIDIPKYNYFERELSTCHRTNTTKKCEDCMKVAEIIYDDCKNSELNQVARDKYFACLINLYRSYYYNKEKRYNKKIKQIRNDIKLFYKKNKIGNKKIKISAILIIYMPYIYGVLYDVYNKVRTPNWDV